MVDHAVRMLEGMVPATIPSLARVVRARLTTVLSDLDESIANYESRFPPVQIKDDEQRQVVERMRDRFSAAMLAELAEEGGYDDTMKHAFIASISSTVAVLNNAMAVYDNKAQGASPQ